MTLWSLKKKNGRRKGYKLIKKESLKGPTGRYVSFKTKTKTKPKPATKRPRTIEEYRKLAEENEKKRKERMRKRRK